MRASLFNIPRESNWSGWRIEPAKSIGLSMNEPAKVSLKRIVRNAIHCRRKHDNMIAFKVIMRKNIDWQFYKVGTISWKKNSEANL